MKNDNHYNANNGTKHPRILSEESGQNVSQFRTAANDNNLPPQGSNSQRQPLPQQEDTFYERTLKRQKAA